MENWDIAKLTKEVGQIKRNFQMQTSLNLEILGLLKSLYNDVEQLNNKLEKWQLEEEEEEDV